MSEEPQPQTEGSEVKRRRTASELFPDVPVVDRAPEGSASDIDVAAILGIQANTMSKFKSEAGFPTPVGRRGKSLFHDIEKVKEWHTTRGQSFTGRARGGAARGAQKSAQAEADFQSDLERSTLSNQSNNPGLLTRMIPGTLPLKQQIDLVSSLLPGHKKLSDQFSHLRTESGEIDPDLL